MFSRSAPFVGLSCGVLIGLACGGQPTDPASDAGLEASRELPFVTGFEPTSSTQGSRVALRVLGENFDLGSHVDLLVSGNTVNEVQTLSTQFVTGTELVADISIGDDAPVGAYQVQVTTSKGKRGIPIEDFVIVEGGSLQVAVATSGEPEDLDPNGYTLTVGDSSRSVAVNGTVTFDPLAVGSHIVRIDGVAENCTVAGENPRTVAVLGGAVVQVSFFVSCPSPGVLLVRTITIGSDLDNDGYTLEFGGSSIPDVPIGANDSLLFEELPPIHVGNEYRTAVLKGTAANCWIALGHWRVFPPLSADTTSRLEFLIECMPWVLYNSGVVYDRVTPFSSDDLDYNGTLTERYILHANNRFRLQSVSGRFGTWESLGAFVVSGSTVSFAFDDYTGITGVPGAAVGTFRGDSLFVEYNFHMQDLGFSDAVFVNVEPSNVGSVTLLPDSLTVPVYDTAQLTVIVRDKDGTVIANPQVVFMVEGIMPGTVESTGLVTGLPGGCGSGTVTARSRGVNSNTVHLDIGSPSGAGCWDY